MSNKRHKRVQASALGYAISFMLLVGLVGTGVVFISSTNKRLERHFLINEHMVMNNYVSLIHGAREDVDGQQEIIHPSGDTTLITRKPWGAFRVIVAETHHHLRSVKRSALVAYENEDPLSAMYVPNRRQTIKLCGDTKIEGTIQVSERGLERGHIAGKPYKNDKLLYGIQKKSERSLPGLRPTLKSLSLNTYQKDAVKIDLFSNDSSFSFSQKTRLVSELAMLDIDQRISGNIVLHSFDSILVRNTAQLENIILIAPVIRFEAGFEGTVQVIATEKIICEKSVKLKYPSALTLHEENRNKSGDQHGVFLREESKVLGGVLLFSNEPDSRKPLYLDVDQATIGGLVYNQGETQLKGKVIGYLYTQRFDLRAAGSRNSDHLLDATISSKQKPEEMLVPQWMTDQKQSKPRVIACF